MCKIFSSSLDWWWLLSAWWSDDHNMQNGHGGGGWGCHMGPKSTFGRHLPHCCYSKGKIFQEELGFPDVMRRIHRPHSLTGFLWKQWNTREQLQWAAGGAACRLSHQCVWKEVSLLEFGRCHGNMWSLSPQRLQKTVWQREHWRGPCRGSVEQQIPALGGSTRQHGWIKRRSGRSLLCPQSTNQA